SLPDGLPICSLNRDGVLVPGGFATTADAYRAFLHYHDLEPLISRELEALAKNEKSLQEAGSAIRRAIHHGEMPSSLGTEIAQAYAECGRGGHRSWRTHESRGDCQLGVGCSSCRRRARCHS